MSKVQNENYYVIHGWMLNELKLNGSELIIYAIIYGFSQNGQGEFSGSLDYLAEFSGCSRRTVIRTLQELTAKGLIIREEIKGVGCRYQAVTRDKMTPDQCQNDTPPVPNCHLTSAKMSPNKEYINNIYLNDKEDGEPSDYSKVMTEYQDNYSELYRAGKVQTEKPILNYKQCAVLIKSTLKKYGLKMVLDVVDRAKGNSFVLSCGYSLNIILSANMINELINGRPQGRGLTAMDKSGIDPTHHDYSKDAGKILADGTIGF